MKYALDSNIIIRYLRGDINVVQNIDNALDNKNSLRIPKMVDYEIRRGFSIKPTPKKERGYRILIENCPVSHMDNASWELAIQIYTNLFKKGFTVGEMDILIASFCLVHNCTLVTHNIKDFINIDKLKIVNWTQPFL